MIDSIPLNLRIAMGGSWIVYGFIGLKSGGLIVSNEATFLKLGNLANIKTLLAVLGFLIISVLAIRKIPGSILIGVLAVTLISLLINIAEFNGIVSLPPSIDPVLFKLDIYGALDVSMITIVMSFLFVIYQFFRTLLGVANRANLVDESGKAENLIKLSKLIAVRVLWELSLVALL